MFGMRWKLITVAIVLLWIQDAKSAKLGDACTSDSECTGKTRVECRNNTCQCQVGFEPESENANDCEECKGNSNKDDCVSIGYEDSPQLACRKKDCVCINDGSTEYGMFNKSCEPLVACTSLEVPSGGEIFFTIPDFSFSYTPPPYYQYAIARYSCGFGTILRGDAVRTCYEGDWSGSQPTCVPIDAPCDTLTPHENGRISLSNGTLYGSIATFYCNVNYGLANTDTLVCGPGGVWNGTVPSCIPDCGEPNAGEYSSFTTPLGTLFEAPASYRCDTGYVILAGNETRTCQENGEWDGSPLNCTGVDCGTPVEGEFSSVITPLGTQFEATANYSCDAGFVILAGDETRTCQANGDWDGSPLNCTRIDCGAPAEGEFSSFITTLGTLYEATVSYSCDVGYVISSGDETRKCQANGYWDGSPLKCTRIDCGAPAEGEFSSFTTTLGTLYEATASYSCDAGYVISSGNETRKCQANGYWDGSPLKCTRIDCGTPVEGEFSSFTTTLGTLYEATASYSCDAGYVILAGDGTRTCQANGVWDGSPLNCTRIDCQSLSEPPNGNVSYIGGTVYEGQATYSCDDGYVLVGSSSSVCQADGQWTGTPPICLIDCGSPTDPEYGSVSFTSTLENAIVNYTCYDGYVLGGNGQVTCQTTGNWTKRPECLPENGQNCTDDCYDVNAVCPTADPVPTCQCKTGYAQDNSSKVCVPGCDHVVAPTHGSVSVTGRVPGSIASFSCDFRFVLVGQQQLTCNENQYWSGPYPECKTECDRLSNPIFGTVDHENDPPYEGTRATFSCSSGYTLFGAYTLTCLNTGEWTDEVPNCRQDCLSPSSGIFSTVKTPTGVEYGDKAFYTCIPGYVIESGDKTRTCQVNGVWDGLALVCGRIDCNEPRNGLFSTFTTSTGTKYEDVATYSCNTGYEKSSGDEIRTCEINGQWTGVALECQIVDCGAPSAGSFATLTTTNTVYNSVASYECNTGYMQVAGDVSRTCQASGTWSGSALVCQIVVCSTPEIGSFSTFTTQAGTEYGDVALYTCNTGYFIVSGDQSRTCQANGAWTGVALTCQIVDCGEPGTGTFSILDASMGTVYASIVTYQCVTGYRITQGNTARTCHSNGQWGGSALVCEIRNCGTPATGSFSTFKTPTGTEYLDTALYSCNTGYIPESGEQSRACLANGTWAGKALNCQIVDCQPLADLSNGMVSYIGGTVYQGQATYSCDSGYVRVGSSSRLCQADGQWTGTPAVCLIDCGSPPVPEYGSVSFTSTLENAVITYTCDNGYMVEGNSQATCQVTGTWSNTPNCLPENGQNCTDRCYDVNAECTTNEPIPSCQCSLGFAQDNSTKRCVAGCEIVPEPTNGSVSVTGRTPGSTATFSCDTGFVLVGQQTLTCNENQFWSGTYPQCKRECNALSTPSFGTVDQEYDPPYEGTSATFSCFAGYTLFGPSELVCLNTGQWNMDVPVCRQDCLKPSSGAFSTVTTPTGVEYGDKAFYTCIPGYVVESGDKIRSCQANGVWDGLALVCGRIDCNSPQTGIFATFNASDGTKYGDVATYICDTGYYRVSGDETRTCGSDGQWSGSALECQIVDCGGPSAGTFSTFTTTSTKYNSIVIYECNTGYVHVTGDFTRTCQSNGTWSGSALTCELIDCSSPDAGLFSTFTTPAGREYGDVALYTCITGYVIQSGDKSRRCKADGTWDGEALNCQKIDCGEPSTGLSSTIDTTSGTEYGSTVTYKCNRGYQVVLGNAVRTCQASGQWSGSALICRIVACNQPESGTFSTFTTPMGTDYGDIATYVCAIGYEQVTGNTERTCRENGDWDGEALVCQIVDCNFPKSGMHSNVDATAGTTYGNTALYTCLTGYSMESGDSIRTCLSNGSWGGTALNCRIVDCQALADPSNGVVTYTGGTVYQGQATYSCDNGYVIVGSASRTCLANGQWADVPPICFIDCGSPADPVFGSVTFQSTIESATAKYTCDLGYVLKGSNQATCLITGSWSDEPECLPENGQECTNRCYDENAECTTGISTPTCQCSTGFALDNTTQTCVRGCGTVVQPTNGSVTVTGMTPGSTATFFCDTGFVLVGENILTCSEKQVWTNTFPECKRECVSLTAPSFGAVDQEFEPAFEGTIATFACSDDHTLFGKATLTCLNTGQWDADAPLCRQDCNSPLPGNFSTVTTTEGVEYGGQAIYTCYPGYIAESGSVTITCLANGVWNGTPLVCGRIDCNSPSSGVFSTYATPNGTKYGDVATYTCNVGYVWVSGDISRTCKADGQWAGDALECQIVDCSTPPAGTFSTFSISSTKYNAVANYDCDTGYIQVAGDVTRTCQSNGTWSGLALACQIIDCGTPEMGSYSTFTTQAGTEYGNKALYLCNTGYILESGEQSRTCLANRTWGGEALNCRIIDCGAPDSGLHSTIDTTSGTEYGNTVTYECKLGYKVVHGNTDRTCQASGQWDGSALICNIIDCGRPDSGKHSSFSTPNGTKYSGVASYVCNTGYYEVSGSSRRTCNENGQWDGSALLCQIVDCKALADPSHGTVSYSGGTVYQGQATYSCDSTYVLEGSSVRVCQSNGQWTGSLPVCLIDCGSPKTPVYGSVSFTSTLEGQVINYSCGNGYVLIGNQQATCRQNGNWDLAPDCLPENDQPCSNACYDNNAECTSVNSTSTCKCKAGFAMNANKTCIPGCTTVLEPDNGSVTVNGTIPGSTALFSCDQGYVLVGELELVCETNQLWSGTFPECKKACVRFAELNFGSVIYENDPPYEGTNAEFSCNTNYTLFGESIVACLSSGEWDDIMPVCRLDCPELDAPNYSQVSVTNGNSQGSVVTYTCSSGSTLNGPNTRQCQVDGTWSDVEPQCIPDCPQLSPVEHGTISLSNGNVYKSVATTTCNAGYTIRGIETRTCSFNSSWSGSAAECTREIKCPVLLPLENGNMDNSSGIHEGQTVTFTCYTDYILTGSPNITCRENGSWSSPQPTCRLESQGLQSSPSVTICFRPKFNVTRTQLKEAFVDQVLLNKTTILDWRIANTSVTEGVNQIFEIKTVFSVDGSLDEENVTAIGKRYKELLLAANNTLKVDSKNIPATCIPVFSDPTLGGAEIRTSCFWYKHAGTCVERRLCLVRRRQVLCRCEETDCSSPGSGDATVGIVTGIAVAVPALLLLLLAGLRYYGCCPPTAAKKYDTMDDSFSDSYETLPKLPRYAPAEIVEEEIAGASSFYGQQESIVGEVVEEVIEEPASTMVSLNVTEHIEEPIIVHTPVEQLVHQTENSYIVEQI